MPKRHKKPVYTPLFLWNGNQIIFPERGLATYTEADAILRGGQTIASAPQEFGLLGVSFSGQAWRVERGVRYREVTFRAAGIRAWVVAGPALAGIPQEKPGEQPASV